VAARTWSVAPQGKTPRRRSEERRGRRGGAGKRLISPGRGLISRKTKPGHREGLARKGGRVLGKKRKGAFPLAPSLWKKEAKE